jgi:uncharacterized protein YndB with AHSA1/START domain
MKTMTEPIVREIHIDATPETVFEFLVDPAKVTRWLAKEATHELRPGGVCHQIHGHDGTDERFEMRGEFVEITRPERVVFTWGWSDPGLNVPPGSSRVEFTLTPDGDGTLVHLEHHDLPVSERDGHAEGWPEVLERLKRAVEASRG